MWLNTFQELHTVILRELEDMTRKGNFTLNITHFLGNVLAQKCKVEGNTRVSSLWLNWVTNSV